MAGEAFEMSPEERQEFILEFLAEAENHILTLNEKLLQAETSVQEGTEMSEADLNEMFRAAHTIKGTSSFIALNKVVGLTHQLETILQCVRKKEIVLTQDVIDVLFKAVDTLQSLLNDLKETSQETTDIEESVEQIKTILAGDIPAAPTAEKEEEPSPEEPQEEKTITDTAISEKYIEEFILDVDQNIESFNQKLVLLEQKPDDKSVINEVFRFMHTIKGSSGMVNVVTMQRVSHSIENILSIVREKEKAFPDMFSLLFKGIDIIKELSASLKKNKSTAMDVYPFVKEADEYFSRLKSGEQAESARAAEKEDGKSTTGEVGQHVPPIENQVNLENLGAASEEERKIITQVMSQGKPVLQIKVNIAEKTPVKSMKALLLIEHLKGKGTLAIIRPKPELIDDSMKGPLLVDLLFFSDMQEKDIRAALSVDGVEVLSIAPIDIQEIQKLLQKKPEETSPRGEPVKAQGEKAVLGKTPQVSTSTQKKSPSGAAANNKTGSSAPAKEAPAQMSTVRIDTGKLDSLMNLSGELVTVRAKFERLVSLFQDGITNQKECDRVLDGFRMNYENLSKEISYLLLREKANKETKNVFKLLDQLNTNLLSLEQRIAGNKLTHQINSLDETTGTLGKIASDIQSGVMLTRMVPIEGVFSKFKRIVRDISKEIGKQVNLVIEGEDTELDKKIVDSLGDPLTHMIRNAVDHGIEDPETRKKFGKPEMGTVYLNASHRGNNVCVEIGDDGKGLNPEALLQHAFKKGLITEEQAERLTEREKLNLLFLPGFSTAAEVTDLSGRGVGMDVVQNMVTAVKGDIDIDTEIGKGTTFVLKIPLTLAIIQALLVVIGEETYAIPLEAVSEILKVPEEEIYSIDGNETIKLRDHALSLIALEDVIHIKGNPKKEQKGKRVVVMTDGDNRAGVVVDALVGESEIVIKSLTHHFKNVKGISGATILGNGQISLILDPASVLSESR